MTEDAKRLIAEMRRHTSAMADAFRIVLKTPDPVDRFFDLEKLGCGDPDVKRIIEEAKAIAVNEIRLGPPKMSSTKVGEILGVSRQRVHQLANPKTRRKPSVEQ